MSSDSSVHTTTYSGDRRIELLRAAERDEEIRNRQIRGAYRKEYFQKICDDGDLEIFNSTGLHFIVFTHLKIKFSFVPSQLVKHVSKKIVFYCTLKYLERYERWNIKRRSTIPLIYKWKVYSLFYDDKYFATTDEGVFDVILKIYHYLVQWSKIENHDRLEKHKRIIQSKEDILFDTDDEEIFLSNEERKALHRRRNKVWRRMLPPEST